MHPSDLELFTTKELVAELMRRKTFLGVIIHSESDFKAESWEGEKNFKVHFNSNLDAQQACCLLDTVAQRMHGGYG